MSACTRTDRCASHIKISSLSHALSFFLCHRYDRDLDAINEPYRPIPSGKIKPWEVYSQMAFLLIGGGALAYNLDGWAGNDWPVITAVATFGAFMAYIYSAPPLKLKAEGWLGTYALGSSYIALPWWCGHAMFNAGTIGWQEVILTILYSIAGLGIAIVNDFKSIEGDRALGMNSLPSRLASTRPNGFASRRSTSRSSASPRTST